MIILNKKRIMFIISCLVVSIFTFNIYYDRPSKSIEVVALPVSNKVVVLDAGHGTPDERGRK